MTSAALTPTRSRDGGLLPILMLWHAALGVLLIVGAVALIGSTPALDLITILLIAAMVLLGIGSAAASVFILRRNHLGRTLSLVVNYILFLACLIGLAQALGLFIGLNDLAEYLARGIPFLMGLVFVIGYFVYSAEMSNKPVPPARRTLGQVLMVAGAIGFLLTAGIVPALASIPGKYAFVFVNRKGQRKSLEKDNTSRRC
jgi:hypothetical protein